MPLGKGLESLIPPKSGDSGSSASRPSQYGQVPAPQHQYVSDIVSPQPAPQSTYQAPVQAAPFKIHEESDLPLPPLPPKEEPRPITRSAEPVVPPQKPNNAVFYIEVEKIRPNPHQPRREFDEVALRELASSIREFGVIQPLIVSKVEHETEEGSRVEYELIAGERRLMASKLAGLAAVPVVVRRAPSDREKLEVAIIENIQRRDLNPIEEAKAYARLQDEFKLTQREIAARLGKSRETVANGVRLLNLPLEVQDAVASGRLSESQARLLLSLDDMAEQKRLFDEILGQNLSVREIKTRITRKKTKEVHQSVAHDPEADALRERLEEFLGTKVDLKDEGDAGRITISFYSKEELKGILEKLFGRQID